MAKRLLPAVPAVLFAVAMVGALEGGLLVFPAAVALLIYDGLGRRPHAAVSA